MCPCYTHIDYDLCVSTLHSSQLMVLFFSHYQFYVFMLHTILIHIMFVNATFMSTTSSICPCYIHVAYMFCVHITYTQTMGSVSMLHISHLPSVSTNTYILTTCCMCPCYIHVISYCGVYHLDF